MMRLTSETASLMAAVSLVRSCPEGIGGRFLSLRCCGCPGVTAGDVPPCFIACWYADICARPTRPRTSVVSCGVSDACSVSALRASRPSGCTGAFRACCAALLSWGSSSRATVTSTLAGSRNEKKPSRLAGRTFMMTMPSPSSLLAASVASDSVLPMNFLMTIVR